jgi:hypothetical protein
MKASNLVNVMGILLQTGARKRIVESSASSCLVEEIGN